MEDFFRVQKRFALLAEGLDPARVERIIEIDIAQLRLIYNQLKNELQLT